MAFLFRTKKQMTSKNRCSPAEVVDYRAAAATDVGSVREKNEDHLIFTRPFDQAKRASHGCLALVADGMGGHSHGELASRMAADMITRSYFDATSAVIPALRSAFDKANKAIYQQARKNPSWRGMGTTCTAVVLLEGRIYLAHVGDSRAYLIRGDQLIQLSTDHTLVQHLLDTGKISMEESLGHPKRNVVTRAMGTSARLEVDLAQLDYTFEPADRLLVCTDGLYEYVQAAELVRILTHSKLGEAAGSLIKLAKQRGGHDNISVLVVETFAAGSDKSTKQTQKINVS